MAEFHISIDLSEALGSTITPFRADVFPHLAYAVDRIVQEAHDQWSAYAHGATLPDGSTITNRTGEYARSILMRKTGDFSGEVYSELPYAKVIEEGAPARDMKKILDSSLKVRLSKDGRRYLIIPFRHNAPGSVMGNNMPAAVHDWWKGQQGSRVLSNLGYKRPSGTGAYDIKTRQKIFVQAHKYEYGTRLGADHLDSMGVGGQQASRLKGMLNFRNLGGAGGASHSSFITFRVMVESSKGWIAPAQPGKFPARTTADALRPMAEQTFRTAVEADVKAILEGIT